MSLPRMIRGGLLLGAACLVGACAPEARRSAPPAGHGIEGLAQDDPLALGWRFASSIANDAKDRARCRENVALALLERGDAAQAIALAEQIENWRQAVVFAEAAAHLAEAGAAEKAERLVRRAEARAHTIQDWQRDRIVVRTVKAKAFLGRGDEVAKRAAFYGSNRDYRAEVAAYEALALAREGRVTNGLARLDRLAGETYFDIAAGRAEGYLMLAREGFEHPGAPQRILEEAWRASTNVSNIRQWRIQVNVVAEATRQAHDEQARAWLSALSSNVTASTLPAHIKSPLLGSVALRWAVLGEAERTAACIAAAEPLIESIQTIEQPALWALLGEASLASGDLEAARPWYRRAIDVAANLVNPRPRGMAFVEICLSLERSGMKDAELFAELKRHGSE